MCILSLKKNLFTVVYMDNKYAVKYNNVILSKHYSFSAASNQIEFIKLLDYKGLRKLVHCRINVGKQSLADDLLVCTTFLAKNILIPNMLGDLSNFFPVLTKEDLNLIKEN